MLREEKEQKIKREQLGFKEEGSLKRQAISDNSKLVSKRKTWPLFQHNFLSKLTTQADDES